VHFLDDNRVAPRAVEDGFDMAGLVVAAASGPVDVVEPDGDGPDTMAEAADGGSQPTVDVVANRVGGLDVPSDLYLHVGVHVLTVNRRTGSNKQN